MIIKKIKMKEIDYILSVQSLADGMTYPAWVDRKNTLNDSITTYVTFCNSLYMDKQTYDRMNSPIIDIE